MIQISITRTSKGYGVGKEYLVFDQSEKVFPNMEQTKAWLKEEYGTCKRSAMYLDNPDGTARQVGYIYGFRVKEYSDSYLQQDWITFYKLTRMTL